MIMIVMAVMIVVVGIAMGVTVCMAVVVEQDDRSIIWRTSDLDNALAECFDERLWLKCFFGRTIDDDAVGQNNDPITDRCFFEVMGRHDDKSARISLGGHNFENDLLAGKVEPGDWFVEQEAIRF